ncbi:hypothetical protein Q6346_11575 [Isoptericola sp. b490]|uniref:hypothetical protein n=1 Tax=Actinotalea lenta TaxID=3064654 RepID=UPI0027125481|nr:hypothetical protein [Isoptericola sp. b490]MDO8121950.1 hypothetical protein [Isoptericola sp. b490]
MSIRSRTRGLVLGYCLGDALARAPEPDSGPLLAGTPSLVFLAGVEGLVRGLVREDLTGRSEIPECTWHATARWAWRTRMRDLPGVRRWHEAAMPQPWPDGWLNEVAPLAIGRGSAPAVEEALALDRLDPRPGCSPGDSAGDMVLSRTLPVALLAASRPWDADLGAQISATARDVAAYSHGLPAQVLAVALTRTAARTLAEGQTLPLVDLPELSATYAGVPRGDEVISARVALRGLADQLAPQLPATDLARAGLASGPRTALRAVAEGLRCVLTHPGRHEASKALREALETGQPGAAAVTGALVGAAHGAELLPVDAISRLDLAHVADQLATDLLSQVQEHPALDERRAPAWRHRYPAW